jgi:Zn-dependent protease
VILAEPSPSQGDLHFSLFGFPVRIHPWFWIMALFLSGLGAPMSVFLWIVAVLVCILLHELGHAVVMRAYGYRPSIVLYSFGGLAIPHAGAYGVRRPGPWGDMLIAFAGPASGFILAAVLVLGLHFLGGYRLIILGSSWRDFVPLVILPNLQLTLFLGDVFYITVMWGLLNLLPIYPLDGGQIAQQIFVLTSPKDAVRQSLILSVLVGGLMTAITLIQSLNEAMHGLKLAGGGLFQDFLGPMSLFLMPMFFGYLTFTSYEMLQSYHGGWR